MHVRRTSALHEHRSSQTDVTYFVTCCTQFRSCGLTTSSVSTAIRAAIAATDAGGDAVTEALTIMPDHLHWLLTLGPRLPLGRLIARFKAQTRSDPAGCGIFWQCDFFEHRLRRDERIEPFGLYIFLNPYRATLLPAAAVWPHWWCPRPEDFLFTAHLQPDGTPPLEWVGQPVPAGLPVGE